MIYDNTHITDPIMQKLINNDISEMKNASKRKYGKTTPGRPMGVFKDYHKCNKCKKTKLHSLMIRKKYPSGGYIYLCRECV